MDQSKLSSFLESVLNTLIGFVVSFLGWPVAALITGLEYTSGQHLGVVMFFTVLSIGRNYVVRRWFNRLVKAQAIRIASMASRVKQNH